MWIAVDDCSVESGTLHVEPRSHTRGDFEHRHFDEEVGRFSCDSHVNTSSVLPCCTKAGGVVFFCFGTAHCTKDNRSNHDRGGVAYHYLLDSAENRVSKSLWTKVPNITERT